jgi:hypothetical protein
VLFSTNDGLTICGAHNDRTYGGSGIGLWANQDCGAYLEPLRDLGLEASSLSNDLRRRGFDYITGHLDRLPLVVTARVARVWSLYAPGYMAHYNEGEGRELWASWLGFASFWLLVPFAVAGTVILRRRRVALTPLLAQFVIVTVTAALVYGLVRFRTPAEVSIVVLAAVAIDRVVARLRPGSSPVRTVECPPETAGDRLASSSTGAPFS